MSYFSSIVAGLVLKLATIQTLAAILKKLHRMTLTDKIWAMFCNMKFKGFIFGLLVMKYQKLDRNVNIFLALASSGSIAAWAVWKDYPFLWSSIIAFSQVIMAIKPFFPYHKVTKELNSRCLKMELLNIEYERLWNKIQRGKLTDDNIEQYYFDFNKTYAEILSFPDDLVFETSIEIEAKANARMKNFLKTFYGINISIATK